MRGESLRFLFLLPPSNILPLLPFNQEPHNYSTVVMTERCRNATHAVLLFSYAPLDEDGLNSISNQQIVLLVLKGAVRAREENPEE